MNRYTLQSYFKNLCNSFYIAYVEAKRLEEENEGIDATEERESIACVREVLEVIKKPNNPCHKYMEVKWTENELNEEKERLDEVISEKVERSRKLEKELKSWREWLWKQKDMIYSVLLAIKRNDQKIIITSKAEVYALMFVYRSEGLIPVLNTEAQYLVSFTNNDEVCCNFLKIYLSENEEEMKEFCSKNI